MIVAAHPDDETLGIGSLLCLLDEALLVHVTDGAPRDGADARVHGFATCAEYADAARGRSWRKHSLWATPVTYAAPVSTLPTSRRSAVLCRLPGVWWK